jgi:hypothetical protein
LRGKVKSHGEERFLAPFNRSPNFCKESIASSSEPMAKPTLPINFGGTISSLRKKLFLSERQIPIQ